ncbi:L-Ala-D/L-Glu epimerase [Microbulbifer celer]|uniref:Dipeptide epimerase n=1 Tax=Microbulbifer celer TaxID=435905 RepID=A0ABW3U5W5_9GAMM|nr:L-Ala-D/L-Glu epimerase [Microbulbifer celer]UFN58446.1 L-Ala-D/L-Glu epimerase [Microbulbifer celer]
MLQVRCFPESWPLKTAFVISRGARTTADVVVVEVEDQGGRIGVGECTPYARYGESAASVLAEIATVVPALASGMDCDALQAILPAGAARNAIDSALRDLQFRKGAQEGVLADRSGQFLPTVQTLVIDSPEAMAVAAATAVSEGVRVLKLKLDQEQVLERVRAVSAAAPDSDLVIDANEAWSQRGLPELCVQLADLGVTMLEQPLPADADDFLETFDHPLPICADESCHTSADLPRLAGRYDMVNIKLDKTGGLTEALLLADAAETQGFELMLGCMLCTSRAIRAAWPLGARARFVDLDGPTWLAKDVSPLRFEAGKVYWT